MNDLILHFRFDNYSLVMPWNLLSIISYVIFVITNRPSLLCLQRLGKVIEGQEKKHVKSKYVEDEYVQNHTTVWGSFWTNGKWGYQ